MPSDSLHSLKGDFTGIHQIVYNGNFVSILNERYDCVGTDEAGATCNKYSHISSYVSTFCPF